MLLSTRDFQAILTAMFGASVISLSLVSAQSGRSTSALPPKFEAKSTKPCKENNEAVRAPLFVMFGVLVTDSSGKPTADITKNELTLFDDDTQQRISLFEKREGPLNYGLLVDASGSLRSQFKQVALAAQAMVMANEPEDEVF